MAEETTQAHKMAERWAHMVERHIERVGRFYSDVASMEHKTMAQANRNLDEATRLTRASFDYAQQLSDEWRRLNLEAAQRLLDGMRAPGTFNPWAAFIHKE